MRIVANVPAEPYLRGVQRKRHKTLHGNWALKDKELDVDINTELFYPIEGTEPLELWGNNGAN